MRKQRKPPLPLSLFLVTLLPWYHLPTLLPPLPPSLSLSPSLSLCLSLYFSLSPSHSLFPSPSLFVSLSLSLPPSLFPLFSLFLAPSPSLSLHQRERWPSKDSRSVSAKFAIPFSRLGTRNSSGSGSLMAKGNKRRPASRRRTDVETVSSELASAGRCKGMRQVQREVV